MILHLVRHPPPVVAPGVCYGRLDLAAMDVAATAERLERTLPPGLPVWSSPLRRCRDLAQALAQRLTPEAAPRLDARLMEMDFGIWEGQRWDDIPRAELDAWAADVAGYAPPGGESAKDVLARALDFVDALTTPEAIVITHGGIIRTLAASVHDLPPAAWPGLKFPYGSLTTLALAR